jgi:hypothetical protein
MAGDELLYRLDALSYEEISEFMRRSRQIELCKEDLGGSFCDECRVGGARGPVRCPGIGTVRTGGAGRIAEVRRGGGDL